MRAVEMFDTNATIPEVMETVKMDVWMQTIENNTTLPTMDCLVLPALNLSFQLKAYARTLSAKMADALVIFKIKIVPLFVSVRMLQSTRQ